MNIFIILSTGKNMEVTKAISAPFHKGINFSYWLNFKNPEAPDACFMTKQDFMNVKSMGVDVVRLPNYLEAFCKKEENWKIPEYIFKCLDNFIEWAKELDLSLIFDFHNNTVVGSFTPVDIEDTLIPIWTQMAERYKDSYEKIAFEIYNEPHEIDLKIWGEALTNTIKAIRKIDTKHYLIAGGGDWNSFDSLKQLPQFDDDKIIYTFHFYEPHLFTHQGAGWSGMARIKDIPFPYVKEKMPECPENPTEREKSFFTAEYDYEHRGTEKAVADYFDQFVQFSNERKAPIFCGEFGVYMPYADAQERVNWYSIVARLLEERNIARTSWDYYGGFGVFNTFGPGTNPQFPKDLNKEIVRALGLKVPEEK
ncbi:MAG: glycoside hydrolase family 5 protein [Treponema sp.]|nr:glycoside hydrolase family 5 protein [Treponema sp.]